MNEKSFCHLNGYRVKDSVARQQIEQIGITPQMYGAIGNGVADDTERINAMFDSLQGGETIFFPTGTYIVSKQKNDPRETNRWSAIRLIGKENIKIILSPNAKIKCSVVEDTDLTQVGVFWIEGCNNIEITGGCIEGEGLEHVESDKANQTLNGGINNIEIRECNNVYIHNMTINNAFADGIMVKPFKTNTKQLENIVVENCHIFNCRRNGINFDGVKNGIIRNCLIHDIKGNSPQCGIDFECEWTEYVGNSGVVNKNNLVDGCKIYNCGEYAVNHSTHSYDTRIMNCEIDGNIAQTIKGYGDLYIFNTHFNNILYCYHTYIDSCKIKSIKSVSKNNDYGTAKGLFKNCNIQGDDIDGTVIYISDRKDVIMFDGCIFRAENPITPGNLVKLSGDGVELEYSLLFNNCIIFIWDNTKQFDFYDNAKQIDLTNCKFIYKNTESVRPLVFTKCNKFNMIDCILDFTEGYEGVKDSVGIIAVRQTNEDSTHNIISNKVITKKRETPILNNFITGYSNQAIGTTHVINNVCVNTPNIVINVNGTLLSGGNVDLSTLSQ